MEEARPTTMRLTTVWEGHERFRSARPEGGPSLVLDGNREAGVSPVEGLIAALASCSAVDVVEILNKRRTPPGELRVEVEYTRAPTPPRRLTSARLRFIVATASARHHVERAVKLSFEQYCSVSTSLDPAIPLSWEVELLPVEGEASAP